jgi:predicted phosphodiesterase
MDITPHEFPADWECLELYPLADLHVGDPKTDIPLFQRFVRYIGEAPNRIVVGVGDLMNNAIKTSVSNVYAETMPPNEQRKWLAEELLPIKDRILCLLDGNHEHRSKKDVDLSQMEALAEKLGVPYYQDEAALKISLGSKYNGKPATYVVYLNHGFGGGKRPGSALNNIELMALSLEGVDIVITGHVHKQMAYRFSSRVFDPRNNTVTQVPRLCVVAAPWQDYGGYAARKGYVPGVKGKTPIILHGREKVAQAII